MIASKNKFCVSLFESFTETKPISTIDIDIFLFNEKYKNRVNEVRSYKDKEQRKALKSKLPCITPSGVFSSRSNAGLIQHSGLICIDIDGKDNQHIRNWDLIKKKLSTFTGLYYCGLSVSGNGLFCLIRIEKPEYHAQHFTALKVDFKKLNINIDEACKDIARLRCISFDETPIYMPMAEVYEKRNETAPKWLKRPVKLSSNADTTETRVKRLIETIQNNHIDITDNYFDWYAVGRALASEFGESGRGLFHIVSQQSVKYIPAECDNQYYKCLNTCTQTGISTFFWMCKQFNLTTK
ncbi:MAG: BT4734/BF3469 family protein [Paludibacteraceae bacterium]|nr:BT4734/BF3469 family protein [Paludibacteraceae bacterium]